MARLSSIGLVVSLILVGCAGFETDPREHEVGFSANQANEEGRKNLAAIRALLSEQRQRSLPVHEQGVTSQDAAESPSWWPDWLASLLLPMPTREQTARRASPPDFKVTIPWVPSPPARGSEYEPGRLVPAYTFFAPVGSAYPGTIRCVPDFSGGQRCH
jgi:hypothetical protein